MPFSNIKKPSTLKRFATEISYQHSVYQVRAACYNESAIIVRLSEIILLQISRACHVSDKNWNTNCRWHVIDCLSIASQSNQRIYRKHDVGGRFLRPWHAKLKRWRQKTPYEITRRLPRRTQAQWNVLLALVSIYGHKTPAHVNISSSQFQKLAPRISLSRAHHM